MRQPRYDARMSDMKNINIRVPRPIYLAARREAGGEGLSLTRWVREQLERILSRSEERVSRKTVLIGSTQGDYAATRGACRCWSTGRIQRLLDAQSTQAESPRRGRSQPGGARVYHDGPNRGPSTAVLCDHWTLTDAGWTQRRAGEKCKSRQVCGAPYGCRSKRRASKTRSKTRSKTQATLAGARVPGAARPESRDQRSRAARTKGHEDPTH